MKCALCGHEFDETRAQAACAGCILAQGCRRIRCPNCGYETLPESAWLRRLFDRRSKDDIDRKS